MIHLAIRTPLALALTLGLTLAALLPAQSQAQVQTAPTVNVVVNGTTFGVTFNFIDGVGGTSFTDDAALIQASPWWGSSADANAFLVAYRDQVTPDFPFDLDFLGPGTFDNLLFAYATDGTTSDLWLLDDAGGSSNRAGAPFFNVDSSFADGFYAYTTTPVPEIDGGALGQAAVILLALFLFLRGRRQAMA